MESSSLDRSSCSATIDQEYNETEPIEFLAFKDQLEKVQNVINECNTKIIDQTLCATDLKNMESEISIMSNLENALLSIKIKSSYVRFKTQSLRMIEDSYRISNWLMDKQCKEMDNEFDINVFVNLILKSCAEKEKSIYHINTLFDNVMKNTNYLGLNFFGNLKVEDVSETESTQFRKQHRRAEKRPLEEQVVPVEVENKVVNSEMVKNLLRIKASLKQALKKYNGKPLSFYKFAIDPYSFTYTVENIFYLASLAKDDIVKIEKVSDDENSEFSTIQLGKNTELSLNNSRLNNQDVTSSLFTINHDLWKHYINKYNITEALIKQDE